MKALGRQLVVEFWGCNELINSQEALEQALRKAVQEANAVLLDVRVHGFNPHGVSGVAIIAESHLAIHTWPEYGYAALDVFTCGEKTKPEAAIKVFRKLLQPERVEILEIKRGIRQ